MTYDYHGKSKQIVDRCLIEDLIGAWDNVTGMNAPLYGKRIKGDYEENRWNVVSDETKIEGNDLRFDGDRMVRFIIGWLKVVQRLKLIQVQLCMEEVFPQPMIRIFSGLVVQRLAMVQVFIPFIDHC